MEGDGTMAHGIVTDDVRGAFSDATRDALLALAERAEAATEPDRALHGDIAEALGLNPPWAGKRTPHFWRDSWSDGRDYWDAPAYTTSLDAAMTLVPKGWGWLVSQPNEKAIASGLLKKDTPVMGEVQYGCDRRYTVAAATPALALCAAALRAHAARLTLSTEDRRG